VIVKTQVVAASVSPLTSELPFIPEPISVFHRVLPVAGLAAAVIINLAWMGFLGCGFFKLVETAFF
jgi:hypothetical protein